MKANFLLIVGWLMMFSVVSCQQGTTTGFKVSGAIDKARGKTVTLDKIDFTNQAQTLSQTEANEGKFEFSFDEKPEPGIYRVKIDRKNVYLILNGKESAIDLSGEFSSFSNQTSTIEGSPLTESFNTVLSDYSNNKDIYAVKEKIKTEDPLVASMVLVNVFGARPEYTDMHKSVSEKMTEAYPDAAITKNYSELVKSLEKSYARQMASQKIKIGADAPEIAMPNPDGDIMKLSDLKGKVVLLDFWASWCGPCRKANPSVVKTYNKYKDQGFTVFSVSLDGLDSRSKARMKEDQIASRIESSKQKWLDAIVKDELTWDSHVSTLEKWDTGAAAAYGVTSIPRTFLIDREGKIAAINPRFNLEEALLQVL